MSSASISRSSSWKPQQSSPTFPHLHRALPFLKIVPFGPPSYAEALYPKPRISRTLASTDLPQAPPPPRGAFPPQYHHTASLSSIEAAPSPPAPRCTTTTSLVLPPRSGLASSASRAADPQRRLWLSPSPSRLPALCKRVHPPRDTGAACLPRPIPGPSPAHLPGRVAATTRASGISLALGGRVGRI